MECLLRALHQAMRAPIVVTHAIARPVPPIFIRKIFFSEARHYRSLTCGPGTLAL